MNTKQAIKKLRQADHAYYFGEPIMTDAEYDELLRKTKRRASAHPYFKRVGAPVPGTVKAKHHVFMGSQDNLLNKRDLKKWGTRIRKKIGDCDFVIQHKLDGLSLELVYEDGELVQAITRGDGEEGEDVTQNVLRTNSVPVTLENFVHKGSVSVLCECVLHKSKWREHFQDTANPRNAAAGTIRRQSGERAEYLDIIAYGLDSENHPLTSEDGAVDSLQLWGFHPVWCRVVSSLKEVWETFQEIEEKRDDLPYEIDGAVLKVDSIPDQTAMGMRNGCPVAMRAMKFKPRGGVTILQEVVWQVGQTGVVTPVAKVAPVGVGGVTIQSATLHNLAEIKRLDIAVGDEVEIVRAADVIPKISRVIKRHKDREGIKIPSQCPSCDGELKDDGTRLTCNNRRCGEQAFQKMFNWVKKRNILYLGEGILRAAFDQIGVDRIDLLYALNEEDWANLHVGNGELGESRAKKVFDELRKSTKNVKLEDFFGSLGIPGAGRTVMKKIVNDLGIESVEELMECAATDLTKVDGVGEATATSIDAFLTDYIDEVDALVPYMSFVEASEQASAKLAGEVICFSGDGGLKRPVLKKIAEDNGAEVKSSVTKNLTMLVVPDASWSSSKVRKAESQDGTKVVYVEDFLKLVDYSFL